MIYFLLWLLMNISKIVLSSIQLHNSIKSSKNSVIKLLLVSKLLLFLIVLKLFFLALISLELNKNFFSLLYLMVGVNILSSPLFSLE